MYLVNWYQGNEKNNDNNVTQHSGNEQDETITSEMRREIVLHSARCSPRAARRLFEQRSSCSCVEGAARIPGAEKIETPARPAAWFTRASSRHFHDHCGQHCRTPASFIRRDGRFNCAKKKTDIYRASFCLINVN